MTLPVLSVNVRSNSYLSLLFVCSAWILLSGCTPKEPSPLGKYHTSSTIKVPFVSPRSDLCGATAIEMVSSYWQTTTSYVPRLSRNELDKRTFIPEKGGTLQVELVSTARANGLLVYPLEPTFDALLRELEQEHPVIVLVNRGYSWYPLWHYAPVTGYDKKNKTVLMHYSDSPNEAMPISTFTELWKRGGNWGVVLLPPGKLPVSASPKEFLRAAYDLEKTGMRDEAIIAYRSALLRWPKNIDTYFALANAYYHTHQFTKAEQGYRKLLSLEPTHTMALNNLADLLCTMGRPEEAMSMIRKAETDDAQMQAILKSTRKEITEGCVP
ncbi:PA2778 family cysteine peptidase [Sulfurovum sp. XTW-4]|uniref:PA2778 family cysteine peptidase n=1 Tax=Sulfurovum xiamenensis TaxID=3019066 RepID=A0ABT7QT23_9BACT|nr:PA2778 family cysteine peptidase [Sulfurovum xiamenensis]MDM5264235.1 PA2778 family cysteine peptidase [Sulfurovum xiamenensis]